VGLEDEVDPGGAGFEVIFGLKAALGDFTDELRKDREARARANRLAIDVRKPASVTSGAAGNAVMSIDGPLMGQVWLLRRLVIGGTNWGSTVAGTAEIYATALMPSMCLVARPINELVDQAPLLPNLNTYTGRQVTLRPNESLVIALIAPTASTVYMANAQFEGYNEADLAEIVAI